MQISTLQKGLVGHWKLDGNARDATPYANHGTVTGATLTTDRKGQANKAYDVNTAGKYITLLSNGSTLGLTSTASFSFWLKVNTQDANTRRIFGYTSSYAQNGQWIFLYTATTLTFGIKLNDTIRNSIATIDLTDGWHHVVGTITGGVGTLYVDSIAKTPSSSVGAGNFNDSNLIRISTTGGITDWLAGSIDDVRIYNRVLTPTEITALYDSYNPGIQVSDLQKGLVGHWTFDGDAKDRTPYGNHGTVTGATLTTDRKGQTNKAYDFPGVSQYIKTPTSSKYTFGTGDFSISAWVKLDAVNTGTAQGVVRMFYNTGVSGDQISAGFFEQSGNIQVHSRNSTGTIKAVTVKSGASTGAWYHVVLTRTSSTVDGYLDGVAAGTPATGADFNYSSTGVAYIGAISNDDNTAASNFLNGQIDDVRIYNRALSPTEITALYDSYNPGIQVSDLQKGLVGQWIASPADTAAISRDVTPQGNNGTVTGATLTTDRKGQADKAFDFNGTNGRINVTHNSALNAVSNGITVAGWFKFDLAGTYQRLIVKTVGDPTYAGYSLEFHPSSTDIVRFRIGDGSGFHNFDSLSTFDTTSWYHIVATYNGSTGYIYINGVENNHTDDAFTVNNSSSTLQFGLLSTVTDPFDGQMDDIRIYNRALSPTEVLELYNHYDG